MWGFEIKISKNDCIIINHFAGVSSFNFFQRLDFIGQNFIVFLKLDHKVFFGLLIVAIKDDTEASLVDR